MSRLLRLDEAGEDPAKLEEMVQRAARFDKAAKELGDAKHTLLIGAGGVGNAALETAARSLGQRGLRFGDYDRETGNVVNAVQIDTDSSVFSSDGGELLRRMGARQSHLHLPRLEQLLHTTGLKAKLTPGRAKGSDDKGAGASPKDGITRMNIARRLGLKNGNGLYLNTKELFRKMVRAGLEKFPMYNGSFRIDAFGGISGGTGPAIRIAIADAIAAVIEVGPDLGVNSNLYLSTIETTKDTESRNVPETLRKINAFVQLLYTLGEQNSERTELLDGSIPHVPNMVYLTTSGNSRVIAPADRSYEPTIAVARSVMEGQVLARNTTLASALMNARRGLEQRADLHAEDPEREKFGLKKLALTAIGSTTINPEGSIPELTLAKKKKSLLIASGLDPDPTKAVPLSAEDRALVDTTTDASIQTDIADSTLASFNPPGITTIDVERDEDSSNRADLAKQNIDNQIGDMNESMVALIDAKTGNIASGITQKAAELVAKGLNVERAYLEDLLVMIDELNTLLESSRDSHARNENDALAAFDVILSKIQKHQNIPWIFNLFLLMTRAKRRLAQERSDAATTLNAYSGAKVKAAVYGLLSSKLVTALKLHVTQLLETNRNKEQNVRELITSLEQDPEFSYDVRTRFDLEAPVTIEIKDIPPGDSAKLGSYSPDELAAYVKNIVLTRGDVDIAGQVTQEYIDRAARVAQPFCGKDARSVTAEENHVIRSKYYGIPGTKLEVDSRRNDIAVPEGADVVALDPGTVSPMIYEVAHQLSMENYGVALEGFDLLVELPPKEREVIFTAIGDLEKMLHVAARDIAIERNRYETGIIRNCAGNKCGLPIFISAANNRLEYKEQTKVSPSPYYCKGCRNHN